MRSAAAALTLASMVCALAMSCATADLRTPSGVEIERNQYRVRGDALMRGRYEEELYALEARDLIRPGVTFAELVTTLNRISEVGANAVSVDLYGYSADGTTLAPDALENLDKALEQIVWRRMGTLCRVLGEDAPQDPEARRAAARAAGRALADYPLCVYWFDGPDAAELAKEFKSAAPDLVVAAPETGDVLIVESEADAPRNRPALLLGRIAQDPRGPVHYILPGTDENYQKFEAAMAYPEESQPWTPDNSVLSEAERAEGFIALFNGRDLDGWIVTGDNKKGWIVRDGAIEWNARGGGSLRTRDRYDNYVLRLEWKIGEGKNSGLHMRLPRANRGSKVGFEFQMLGYRSDPPTKDSTGAIYDVVAPPVDASRAPGEWNELEIVLDGPRYKSILNGQVIHDLSFDDNEELRHRLRNGFIALTDHGGYVAFRNIRLKPLGSGEGETS